MKFGCFGCLTILFLGLVAFILIGGFIFLGYVFDYPENPEKLRPVYSSEDGVRGQQKLAELLVREAGLSTRRDPIVITQRELNGFLARHLQESRGIPFSPLILRFGRGDVALEGGTTLATLLRSFPWRYLVNLFPSGSLERKVWVSLRGTARTSAGRMEIELTDFGLGKQSLPPSLFRWVIGSQGEELLSFRLPKSVERIEIEEGRAVITTRPR